MRDPRLFLQDILDACTRIDRFIGPMSLDDFSDDDKTLSAVRDQIMIIGEAVKQIPVEMKVKISGNSVGMRLQGCEIFSSMRTSELMSG